MVRAAVRDSLRGRPGRLLLLASLLVLVAFLGHQLIMASPQHAEGMVMDRGQGMGAADTAHAIAASADDRTPHPAPGDRPPLSGWAECFSQDGVLPTLLLILIIVALWRPASVAPSASLARAGRRAARFLHPPPLEPARRRALLQVFLN
jgi:hypothetical protein